MGLRPKFVQACWQVKSCVCDSMNNSQKPAPREQTRWLWVLGTGSICSQIARVGGGEVGGGAVGGGVVGRVVGGGVVGGGVVGGGDVGACALRQYGPDVVHRPSQKTKPVLQHRP